MKPQIQESGSADQWDELSPMLDELVGKLKGTDQRAIVLRYYQGKSFPEIGSALGITEEAVRKRVQRAIDRLRNSFSRRGAAITAAGLGAALATHTTHAATSNLALASTTAALGTSTSALATALAAGGIALMAVKTKLAIAATIFLLLLICGGVAVYV